MARSLGLGASFVVASLPPPAVLTALALPRLEKNTRNGALSVDRGGRGSAGEECFVEAITLKIKKGPASPGATSAENSSLGGTTVGGQDRGGAQPHHNNNVKWAPFSAARRMSTGGEGIVHRRYLLQTQRCGYGGGCSEEWEQL